MLAALILASVVADLPAQRPGAEGGEIIVTGERIDRSRHETASSVTVETGTSIDTLAAPDRIEQLLQMVPNVQLGSGGEGPVIRGQDSTGVVRDLPAFLSGTRPRMTIRVDGRSATYYELAFGLTSLWDVGRVEVFRSPQTTTQGRNSIGGAIFVESNEPAFEWEGRARFIAGDSATRQAAEVVSGPLLDDELAFRLSGDSRRSRTSSRITSPAIGIDPNRDDSALVRLKFLARPKGLPDFRFDLAYSHGRSQMPQVEGVRPPFEARHDFNANYGIFEIEVDSLTGRLAYQPSGDLAVRTTVSFGSANVRRHAPAGLGEARIDARDFSIEPVVAWRPGSGTGLTGGVHYTWSTLDQVIDLTTFPQVLGIGAFVDTQYSLGVFGEAFAPLTPKVTITAGLRYQRDRQVRQGGLNGKALVLPLAYEKTFDAWLPKLSLAWDVSPDIRIGALAQRASNPGGVNLNTNRRRVETFAAERLWDFELFARARLAGGKLIISANAFRYEMFDAQRTQTIFVLQPSGQPIPSTQVDNAPRAWTHGLELDAEWQFSSRWQVRGAIGLLDSRITRTLDPADAMLGKQFQRSPHFSGSASVVWTPHKPVMLSAQIRHNSSYFSDDLETSSRLIAGATTVDARASWTWRGVEVFGYVRNLFDTFHLTYRFSQLDLATAGDPRELGLGISARF